MPHQFIIDLKPGQTINQFLLVKKKERRRTRTGKDYLDLVLVDRSGSLGGKIWSDRVDHLDPDFEAGQFAGVSGRVESYQGELQITVERIKGVSRLSPDQLQASHFDPNLLLPVSPCDPLVLWQEIRSWAEREIQPEPLRQLTLTLLDDYRESWMTWPAAKQYHHAYQGGLLEHSHRVALLARKVLEVFPDLHRGLVLAGAILHDIGKIREIDGHLTAQNSLEGQLLGHIALGWEMVRDAGRGLDWEDPRIPVQLEHILLSHHGQLEFGSPVLPQTPEALLIHTLDDLEGKLKMIGAHREQDRGDTDFTDWHRVMKRRFLKANAESPDSLFREPEPPEARVKPEGMA